MKHTAILALLRRTWGAISKANILMPKIWYLYSMIFASGIFLVANSAAYSRPFALGNSKSVAESKKRNLFIKNVRVKPESFLWKSHKVTFREAWREVATIPSSKSSDPKISMSSEYICLTLNIDDSPQATKSLQSDELVFVLREKWMCIIFTSCGTDSQHSGQTIKEVQHVMGTNPNNVQPIYLRPATLEVGYRLKIINDVEIEILND